MNREFVGALLQLNAEKNISREQLIATLGEAIQSAYRRTAPGNENVYVDVDPDSGRFSVYRAMIVVDDVEDETIEFTVDDARKVDPNAKVGDLVKIADMDINTFGRIQGQMATQLFHQRLREVEREQVFGQYAQRESEIITGTVSRVEPRGVILDVGRAEAILPTTDQSATEHYRIGQHVKAYVLEVRRTTKGPLIYISRTHKNFLRRLFELEVPEIHAGTVEIKAIAREAGSRSKVAVASRQDGLDPVGATVGQRGGRVQAVVAELGGEKIDIIPWHEDPAVFVANALSPAQVVNVTIDEENRIANVTVPERMLSLAIGREGQNARLAAKLTGWRIDIRSDQAQARPPVAPAPADETAAVTREMTPAVVPAEMPAAEAAAAEAPVAARPAKATLAKRAAATRASKTAPVDAEVAPADDTPAKPPAKAARKTKPTADVPATAELDSSAEAEAAAAGDGVRPKRTTRATKAAKPATEVTAVEDATSPELVGAGSGRRSRKSAVPAADEGAGS